MNLTSASTKFMFVLIYVIGILCGIWLQTVGFPKTFQHYNFVVSRNKNNSLLGGLLGFSGFYSSQSLANRKLIPEASVSLTGLRDSHKHHDDDSKAKELSSKVKVLVWVMTAKQNHKSKAMAVKKTWGKHCDKILYISDAEDKELPTIAINKGTGRGHLTAKTMKAFDYAYKHYLDKYDWFMKVDDDTYVVMENLRYMLSGEDPDSPIFFGHHFKTNVKQGYFSGGGGYVISKEALRRYGKRKENLCVKDGGAEDVQFGICMQKLGVTTGDSRDSMNRTRFHCFDPPTHLLGGYPGWYYQYDKYNATKGVESISDYAITFHYVAEGQMANLEFLLYHLRPYGISSGVQDINKHHYGKEKNSKS